MPHNIKQNNTDMKTLTLLALFTFIIPITLFSQGCLPNGISFSDQESIDNFQTNFPGCSVIEGDVLIHGDNINNLNGLIVLDSIYGLLRIVDNPLLENLNGLNNLTMISDDGWGGLDIWENASLNNFEGLESLIMIGGHFSVASNPNLSTFSGLDSLNSIGDSYFEMGTLEIIGNLTLDNISGLESLTSIAGDLRIGITFNGLGAPNPNLTDISALGNLTSVGQSLRIGNNESLISFEGLENLTSIGWWLEISSNSSLTTLTGLENISSGSIGWLTIINNELLSTCEVQSICEYVANPNGDIEIENNATGCNSPEEVETACTVGVRLNTMQHEILLYPNPTTNELFITTKNRLALVEVNIYNYLGQKLLNKVGQTNKIDVSMLRKGIYIIELVSIESRYKDKLIIK